MKGKNKAKTIKNNLERLKMERENCMTQMKDLECKRRRCIEKMVRMTELKNRVCLMDKEINDLHCMIAKLSMDLQNATVRKRD